MMKKTILGTILLSSLVVMGFTEEVSAADVKTKDTDGVVKFQPSTDPEGPLSLKHVPTLDFGNNEISTENQVYHATAQKVGEKNSSLYTQVTDNRGSLEGWRLSVKQGGQFKSSQKAHELKGASIEFKEGQLSTESLSQPGIATETFKLDPTGASQIIMAFKKDQGAGAWSTVYGDDSNLSEENGRTVTKSVQLSVPGISEKVNDVYQTSLTWILSDVPGN